MIVLFNPAALKVIGLPLEKVKHHHYGDIFPGWVDVMKEYAKRGTEPIQIELKFGESSWFQLTVLPLNNPLSKPYKTQSRTLVVLHDISGYKRLENALEASQDLYRNVTEQAEDGIVIVQDDLMVYLNPKILTMTGYLAGDLLYRSFEDFISKEHIQIAHERYARRYEGESQDGLFESEIIRQDGTRLPVEIKIGLMTFEEKPAALTMIQDITERKRAEGQLRLQSEALQSAANSIVITDQNGAIQWVNPAFTEMTGYEFDEALGQYTRILKSSRHDQAFYRQLWETITAGQIWHGEIVNRRKDGVLYDEQMTIAPVKDELGVISHFVAIKENITERKRSERALRQSEQQFKELVLSTPVPMMIYQNDGKLVLVNWKFTEVFGYKFEDILTIEGWWPKVIPEENSRHPFAGDLTNAPESLVESSGSKPVEAQVICKDGSSRLVDFSFVPLGEKYIIALTDRTKQKRAENHLRQRARHLALLNEITRDALEANNLESLCQSLADRMGELFEADGCYLTLWDENKQQPIPMAAYGPMRNIYKVIAQPSQGEPSLTETVLRRGQVIAVDDVLRSPFMSTRIAARFPTRSMLGLPLIADQQKLGAALVSFEKPHTFTQEEILRGEQAAAQVALAIAKTKLFEAEHEKHQLSSALMEISTLLGGSLNVDVLLTRMLDLIQRVVPYDAGNIFIIEEGRSRVLFTRGYDQFSPELDEFVRQMEFEIEKTPNLLEMVKTCRPLIIPDTSKDPDWVKLKPVEFFHSWAGAPIHYEGRVLAVFSIEKQEPNFFQQEHIGRLAAFAGQAAIVLENARVFDEMHQLAILDSLTGAFTRRHIIETATHEIERANRYAHALCAIMLDIDHFKNVNDTYGHQVGDVVLQKTIGLCRVNLRKNDLIGRYGGEEFLIILPQTETTHAIYIAERIRGQIERMEIETDRGSVSITVSIGVSQLEINRTISADETLDKLVYEADQALYSAKQAGRNCVAQYSGD